MGNKISVDKNININHQNYITNIDLFIHFSKNNDYFISNSEFVNFSYDSKQNLENNYYIVPKNSIIQLYKFDFINNHIKLLAKIIPSPNSDNPIVWNNIDKLVNVLPLFNLSHNDCLKPN